MINMYQIRELAELAGVTTRTLRYYHQIGLLEPETINQVGHRLYSKQDVKKLQRILFLKELDFTLEETREILRSSDSERLLFLTEQHQALLQQKNHLTKVISLIEKTIAEEKGEMKMTDKERFEIFKEKQIKDNKNKYGKELISKYGEETLSSSEEKYRKLSKEELTIKMTKIEKELFHLLKLTIELPSANAKKIFLLHQQWLSFTLDLTPDMHRALVDMYLSDERFTNYYDTQAEFGATKKLHDIVYFYTK